MNLTETGMSTLALAPATQDEIARLFVGFELSKAIWLIGLNSPQLGKTGVDPVWWTPFHLRRRCHRCRRVTDPMRRNSGDRWLIWSDLGEQRRSCRASSNRLPKRSGIGFVRPIVMPAADKTARPAPS